MPRGAKSPEPLYSGVCEVRCALWLRILTRLLQFLFCWFLFSHADETPTYTPPECQLSTTLF